MIKTRLKINNICLMAYVGYTQAEREKLQPVRIDVEVHFNHLPLACESDKLEDTVCYDAFVSKLRDYCYDRQFHMIEHMGYGLFLQAKNHIKNAKIKLSLSKLDPPVDVIKGAASFECEDCDE